MSKLFSPQEELKIAIDRTNFATYYKTASFVATEAVGDYLAATQDVFANTTAKLFDYRSDQAFIDCTENKYRVKEVLKRIQFSDLAPHVVQTPEKFKGEYLDYVQDLITASEFVFPNTVKVLDDLKMAIASFINETNVDGVLTIYGYAPTKKVGELMEREREKIADHFRGGKSTYRAKVSEVVRSKSDIERLLDRLAELHKVANLDQIESIHKLAKGVAEMVDDLIKQNTKTNLLTNNSTGKTELIEMLEIGSFAVESCSYLYANTMYLYNAFRALSEAVLEVGASS